MPPDKFVKQQEEDLSMPLNAEDEVALLLKEVQLAVVFAGDLLGLRVVQCG